VFTGIPVDRARDGHGTGQAEGTGADLPGAGRAGGCGGDRRQGGGQLAGGGCPANWQPQALATQRWRSASRTARSRRSGPADRFHTYRDQALEFPAVELRRAYARNSQHDRKCRSARLQRTGPVGSFQYRAAVCAARRRVAGTPCDRPPEVDLDCRHLPGPGRVFVSRGVARQPLGGCRAGVPEPGGGEVTGGLSQRRV
jgi:hypothetical protein